ncbi:MAG: segregation/condensation protein A, partial [Pseudomonadota bacterium]
MSDDTTTNNHTDTFEEDTLSVTERLAAEALIVDVDGYEGPL